jgi:quercetin dioxygenase-like cupin family protein
MTKPHSFLPDLISATEIPHEGTLSKVVFKNDQLRVVVFAFDRDQELTEHTAALPAIVQVLSGRLRLTMGSETVDVEPGDWAHMSAKLPHSIVASEPSVMLLTMLAAPGAAPNPGGPGRSDRE